jgi:hypothetical protein
LRIDSPRCQGAAGFLRSAGRIELRDVTIECSNDFAAVWVIALDDLPLALSKKILVQTTTQEQPYGFKMDGEQITSMGERPFGMKKIQCTVTLDPNDGAAQSVVALDENGYPRKEKVTVGANSDVKLLDNALYHVVAR